MSDETEILAALIAASMGTSGELPGEAAPGAGPARWEDFLARLAEATLAESALLRLAWPGSPLIGWQVGAPWEGPSEATVERMRSGRVYSQIDLPVAAGEAPDPAQPLRALRWRIGRGGGPTARVLLALRRSGEDFRAMDGLQLAGLTPYLGVALGGWRQLAQERARAALERGLCGDLGAGWIVFAPSGQVSAMSEGLATRLEALAGIAQREGGRLALPEPEAQALRQALAALARPGVGPQSLTLSRAPLVQLVLSAEELAGEPALLGRLRHGLSARALPPDRLTARLGLSRSEARLAACLCDGLSLAAAAEELGWTLETARSCSKQLFARLGVSGQPGAVRRVLESGAWLG